MTFWKYKKNPNIAALATIVLLVQEKINLRSGQNSNENDQS